MKSLTRKSNRDGGTPEQEHHVRGQQAEDDVDGGGANKDTLERTASRRTKD